MKLGAFSISLTVKDLAASKAFYEKLGFTEVAGDMAQDFLIMANGDTKIDLFHGKFDQNLLTFNPGWDQSAQPLEAFDDVRAIQAELKAAGLELALEADPAKTGAAHIFLTDPDGNPILIDQHV
ncbi:MAG: VOC family protein [Pseudomonadota bacterium]